MRCGICNQTKPDQTICEDCSLDISRFASEIESRHKTEVHSRLFNSIELTTTPPEYNAPIHIFAEYEPDAEGYGEVFMGGGWWIVEAHAVLTEGFEVQLTQEQIRNLPDSIRKTIEDAAK